MVCKQVWSSVKKNIPSKSEVFDGSSCPGISPLGAVLNFLPGSPLLTSGTKMLYE